MRAIRYTRYFSTQRASHAACLVTTGNPTTKCIKFTASTMNAWQLWCQRLRRFLVSSQSRVFHVLNGHNKDTYITASLLSQVVGLLAQNFADSPKRQTKCSAFNEIISVCPTMLQKTVHWMSKRFVANKRKKLLLNFYAKITGPKANLLFYFLYSIDF